MNIWLAALYSLCILGTGAIIFALGARFIIWVVESENVGFFCWLRLSCAGLCSQYAFTSKEALLYDPHVET